MMFFKLWKHDLDYGLLRKMVFYVLLGFGQAFLFCRGVSSWAAAMSSIPDVGELTETSGIICCISFRESTSTSHHRMSRLIFLRCGCWCSSAETC